MEAVRGSVRSDRRMDERHRDYDDGHKALREQKLTAHAVPFCNMEEHGSNQACNHPFMKARISKETRQVRDPGLQCSTAEQDMEGRRGRQDDMDVDKRQANRQKDNTEAP